MTTMRSTSRSTTFSGKLRGARRHRFLHEGLDRVVFLVVVADQLRVQRLRQLRAIAIKRVGFQRELPGQKIGGLAILHRGVVRHIDGLGDRARDERLRRRHHADVALDRQIALADLAARVGAIEHAVMLGLQMRRAFHRHRAADVHIGGLDLALGESDRREQVEIRRGNRFRRKVQGVAQKILAEGPFVEGELDVERGRQGGFHLLQRLVGEALCLQGRGIDRRGRWRASRGRRHRPRSPRYRSRDSRARAAPRAPRG